MAELLSNGTAVPDPDNAPMLRVDADTLVANPFPFLASVAGLTFSIFVEANCNRVVSTCVPRPPVAPCTQRRLRMAYTDAGRADAWRGPTRRSQADD